MIHSKIFQACFIQIAENLNKNNKREDEKLATNVKSFPDIVARTIYLPLH